MLTWSPNVAPLHVTWPKCRRCFLCPRHQRIPDTKSSIGPFHNLTYAEIRFWWDASTKANPRTKLYSGVFSHFLVNIDVQSNIFLDAERSHTRRTKHRLAFAPATRSRGMWEIRMLTWWVDLERAIRDRGFLSVKATRKKIYSIFLLWKSHLSKCTIMARRVINVKHLSTWKFDLCVFFFHPWKKYALDASIGCCFLVEGIRDDSFRFAWIA